MGMGPTLAIPKALKRAGLSLKDVQLLEINEAFAATFLACEKAMGFNREITNVNGGAIALGHPVGATGARISITLLHEMKRRGLSIGVASACVGARVRPLYSNGPSSVHSPQTRRTVDDGLWTADETGVM